MTEPRTFKVSSPAKLNLTFSVLGHLPGGFHEVETLMQAIDLEDELKFSLQPSQSTKVVLTASGAAKTELPLGESNLIAKAVRLFVESQKTEPVSVSVEIKKVIPVAAGMGGGSSNAASTLLVLNRYFNNPLSKSQLEDMASQLGADVPFFIHGGVQIGRHRGDKLTAVASAERMHFVVVKPREIAIATPWIYSQFDQYVADKNELIEVSLKSARSAREDGNVPLAARAFLNVFEPIVMQHYPDLIEVQDKLMSLGALGCCMTGSGPTIFAICDTPKLSGSIFKELKRLEQVRGNQKLTLDFWPVATIDRGPTVMESSAHAVRQRR